MMPRWFRKHDRDPQARDRPARDAGVCWRKSISSDPSRLREVRIGIERLTRQAGFDEQSAGEIALCVNEALANIMRHAYHGERDRPIQIDAQCDGRGIELSLRDWGDHFDPAAMKRPYDPEQPGGLGLICMKRLMDEVKYQPQQDGTLLTMRRRRKG
jgi:anti-sigma regulatory factor (Ser/Thr protein kinase)